MLRVLPLVPVALLALSACADSSPYSQTDLTQVRRAYATIGPIYQQFKIAFARNDKRAMDRLYRKEQAACRQVDVIDQRDTIDPNTNLFQASAGLDAFCNDIESAYNTWRAEHGLPYDTSIPPAVTGSEFKDGDSDMLRMTQWLSNPAAQS